MTDALTQAAEALRHLTQWIRDWAPEGAWEPGENYAAIAGVLNQVDTAIAAIEAEQSRITELEAEKARLTAALAKAREEEREACERLKV